MRKSEEVPTTRLLTVTKKNVSSYFSPLRVTLTENLLKNEPGQIFNINEIDL